MRVWDDAEKPNPGQVGEETIRNRSDFCLYKIISHSSKALLQLRKGVGFLCPPSFLSGVRNLGVQARNLGIAPRANRTFLNQVDTL